MTVYVVEKGCDSDRYVAAIFSSRELAEAYIAEHGPNDSWNESGSVEEFVLDERVGYVKRTYFNCTIDLETGEILQNYSCEAVADPHQRGDVDEILDHRNFNRSAASKGFGRIVQSAFSYESADHARKLAIEARQAWLRQSTEPIPTSETPPA